MGLTSLSGDSSSSNPKITTKLADNYARAINTYSEVLSVLELALSEKGSTVVSAGFVREVIDEAYKNLAYASNHLQNALDELDEFNKAI